MGCKQGTLRKANGVQSINPGLQISVIIGSEHDVFTWITAQYKTNPISKNQSIKKILKLK
jgi:hypothetical protein